MAELEGEPQKKKLNLATSQKERFKYVSTEEMSQLSKGFTPANTEKNTKWALKCFCECRSARNGSNEDSCPLDLLEIQNPADLDKWISNFIAEVCRVDGKPYPPRSIHQLLSGLLRYMRQHDPDAPNILDRKNPKFKSIAGTCESVFRKLHKEGVGASISHTSVITVEEEQRLWDLNILSVDTPKGLPRAVFFYIGKICCLRGGEEHRLLKPSQFQRSPCGSHYTYTENGSKNRSGGINQINVANKVVTIVAVPENRPCCAVYLLDIYLSKLPPYAFQNNVFYLRPKPKTPAALETEPWYENSPVGRNKLAIFVKEMFLEAGFEENPKTNHSLRATGATALFKAGVLEKIIQKTTGHRSLEALRSYERTSLDQEKEACRVLTSIDRNVSYSIEEHHSQSTRVTQSKSQVPSFQGCSIGSITINIKKKTRYHNMITEKIDLGSLI